MTTSLKNLESLLYRLITAPSGVAEGLAAERNLPRGGLDAVVVGDERLSAAERVDIYANMYFYRLLDALKEDYPATLAVLGADGFHNLVTGYLLEHPPTEPSIFYCGRFLSGFLRDHPLSADASYLADLAALERATVAVFHGPDADALDADTMRATPPDEWPALQLRLHPAAQILHVKWRVVELLRAIEEHREWKPAQSSAARIVVSRRDRRVLYRELEPLEYSAIDSAITGATFAEICDLVGGDADAGGLDPVATLNRLLARWLSDGIFTKRAFARIKRNAL
ncbi:MAG: DNA-binding domain-containing protein [Candidatus Binatus sp.]|uniref:HvfC/BufC N-terminal domain-containing protein n=1 Tax=Candidatus Binatus sp. TaxID=2811406 RepID=UPI00271F4087|nr:DNA-binding domain-containing protein [Candidatus Binatus sp.]MDO8434870.1 DNA-binding domain-containing protein [Candidatus Binatus sp.]